MSATGSRNAAGLAAVGAIAASAATTITLLAIAPDLAAVTAGLGALAVIALAIGLELGYPQLITTSAAFTAVSYLSVAGLDEHRMLGVAAALVWSLTDLGHLSIEWRAVPPDAVLVRARLTRLATLAAGTVAFGALLTVATADAPERGVLATIGGSIAALLLVVGATVLVGRDRLEPRPGGEPPSSPHEDPSELAADDILGVRGGDAPVDRPAT